MRLFAKALLVAGFLALATVGTAQQPPARDGKGGQGGPSGQGGRGGMRGGPPTPGQVLPPALQEQLKLTDDQKKQLAALQKEVDEKLEKMLTDDQKKTLKEMKERGGAGGPGGPGGGGRGGRGGDGPPDGGRGGRGGPPPGDR